MPALGRAVASLLGTALIAVGVLILVGTGAMYLYGQVAQANLAKQAARDLAPNFTPRSANLVVTPTFVSAVRPLATPTPASVPAVIPSSTPLARPSVTSAPPTATPRPIDPAQRIVAPSIGLDAGVVESPLVDGQWTIPKFEAGHLQGTAQPLTGGNVVLVGHVESIASGDVFARIGDLKAGDPIRLYTKRGAVTYNVRDVRSVSNDDVSVLNPQKQDMLTLITCAGSWLPLQENYSQRTIVVAVLSDA